MTEDTPKDDLLAKRREKQARDEHTHTWRITPEAAEVARRRMESYVAQFGMPTELQDFSVTEEAAGALSTSGFRASILVELPVDGTDLHPGFKDMIKVQLAGRDPLIVDQEGSIGILFKVEDDSLGTKALTERFAITVALLINGVSLSAVGHTETSAEDD